MTRADNTRYLAQAAAHRHQAALCKASDAIERLDRSGQVITFSAVAAAAGVSRTWLYRNPGIRDLITRLRSSPSRTASTPAAHRATADSLRARLDAAREEISRLRAENASCATVEMSPLVTRRSVWRSPHRAALRRHHRRLPRPASAIMLVWASDTSYPSEHASAWHS
jgi:hypothetical protein